MKEGYVLMACRYAFDHPFRRYSPRPLIIQGAGAGADVTAMGVTVRPTARPKESVLIPSQSDCLKVHERLRLKAWGSTGF
jgi:hypothetical protein